MVEFLDQHELASAMAHLNGLLGHVETNKNLRKWVCSIWQNPQVISGPVYRAVRISLDAVTDALQKKGVETEYDKGGEYRSLLHMKAKSDFEQSEITKMSRGLKLAASCSDGTMEGGFCGCEFEYGIKLG